MNMESEAIEAMDMTDTFVPHHLRDGIIAYIEIGRSVGSFMTSIICNDLKGAVFSAHPGVLINIPSIVRWFWNYAPLDCHGSENHHRGYMDCKAREIMEQKESA